MGRLVVVSNRVGPLGDAARAGGLAVALADVLRAREGMWFGWSGDVSDDGSAGPLHREEKDRVQLVSVDLTPADYEEFYLGYSNRTLWPILHYRLDLADFDRRFEAAYERVNRAMAERLRPLIGPDDTIWVHDYHFFYLGRALRALGVANPIGFFLHVPFPVQDILTALPRHQALADGLIAYDLVGFQTRRDRDHFLSYCLEERGATASGGNLVTRDGRRVRAAAFPIGIDTAGFAAMAGAPEARRAADRLKRMMGARRLLVGVDRIDYSKGLPQRLRAFDRLLEAYPEHRNRISLMQVAPPSRSEVDAYADIRRELEGLAGHINGLYAELDWTPIRFLSRAFPRRTLAGIYRASHVGLVTPLRDGMNLVAKEYVAAQDPADPGVLVLSRFAGAAEEMREALVVNPHATEDVAETLQQALGMPLDERRARHEALMAGLTTHDATAWAASFLASLDEVAAAR